MDVVEEPTALGSPVSVPSGHSAFSSCLMHPEPLTLIFFLLNLCIPAWSYIALSHTWSVCNLFNAISTLLKIVPIPAILFHCCDQNES